MTDIHIATDGRRFRRRAQHGWGEVDHAVSAVWLAICIGLVVFWAAVLALLT